MQMFPLSHHLAIFLFSGIVIFMINGNRTSCRPIRSVIIFCYHAYDYDLEWTPLSPIAITNNVKGLLFKAVLLTVSLHLM